MAFYIHHVPRTMWAGPPSEAQQQKALLHCDKESPVALHNKMMSSACVQGCQQDGGGVLPTRAFLHSTSFSNHAGFFISFLQVHSISKGGNSRAKLSLGQQGTAPHLFQTNKSGRSTQDPTCSPRVDIKPL